MRDRVNELDLSWGVGFGAAAEPPSWHGPMPLFRGTSATALLDLSNVAGWVVEAAKQLESLSRLSRGWDSYGGLPLNPDAREFSVRALGWLEQQEMPTPAVVLGPRGTVQLEWRSGGRELDVELGDGNTIEYVKVDSQGNIVEGSEDFNYPVMLLGLADWLMTGASPESEMGVSHALCRAKTTPPSLADLCYSGESRLTGVASLGTTAAIQLRRP